MRVPKNLARGVAAAGVVAALGGMYWLRANNSDKQQRELVQAPYHIKVEDRWGYLKSLADTNRDRILDESERRDMHSRMGVTNEAYLKEADRGARYFRLSAFEKQIEDAIKSYEIR